MCIQKPKHAFSLLNLSCLCFLADGLLFNDVYWTTAIKLSEYEGYKSVSLLSYEIPAQSTRAVFTFQARTTGNSCNFKEVHVYFQHGSYPLVTPYNETFPPNFYLNRTGAFHVKIQRNADAVSYMLATPRPGRWYFAAFLPKPSSDKIQQKGLSKSCRYGMVVVVQAEGIDDIPTLSLQKVQQIKLSQSAIDSNVLYRYQLPKNTVQYSVVISNCRAKYSQHKVNTDSANSSTVPFYINRQHLRSAKDFTRPTLVMKDIETDSNQTFDSSVILQTFSTDLSPLSTDSSTKPTNLVLSSAEASTLPSPTITSTSETHTTTASSDLNICPLVAYIKPVTLPMNVSLSCGNASSCRKMFLSPHVEDWTYITIEIDNNYNVSEVSFDLHFKIKECEQFLLPKVIMQRLHRDSGREHEGPSQESCVKMSELGRFDWGEQTYNVTYVLTNLGTVPTPSMLDKIQVMDYVVLVTSFVVQEPGDLGGTLAVKGELDLELFDTKSQSVVVYMCLLHGALPGGQTVRTCETGIPITLNMTEPKGKVYVPYPEQGVWYLGLNAKCMDKQTGSETKCYRGPEVNLHLSISGCVDGQCGEYGECEDYISGVHIFSTCKCYAGWAGYGCTDGTHSRSRGEELTAVLLLTLSNLFFIPSAVLAVYRRYFVEAAIYTFTMFMSTFYHACDTSDLVFFCLLRYDVLSFADFLSSISSFWVTMLVMSKLPKPVRGFAQTVGAVGIAVGVEYDRHGLLVFAVPAGLAAVIMFGSWIFQCGRTKKLYPSKRYFLIHLLPGAILAIVGLVLFAFLETDDNYKYTHSCWHVAMSTSIVFLLPPRERKEKSSSQELTLVTDDEAAESS